MPNAVKKTIKSIVDPSRPVTYGVVQPGDFVEDGIPLIRGQDYSPGRVIIDQVLKIHPAVAAKYGRSKVKENDILFSIVGYLGQVALVPHELRGAQITQTTARIALNSDHSERYFLHQFRSDQFKKEIIKWMKGSAQPGLNLKDVEQMEVVVPPLPEQKRIAEILDEVDRQLEDLDNEIKKDETTLVGISEHLFGASPSSDTYLGQQIQFITYGFTSPMPTTETGPKMVTAADIKEGDVKLESARTTSERAFNLLSPKSKPLKGDVLLTKDGTLGRVAIVEEAGFCINQSVALLRPKNQALSQALYWYLSSPPGQRELLKDAGGSSIKHLYISKIPNIPFPVLSETEWRNAIGSLENFRHQIKIKQKSLMKVQKIKQGLIQKLIGGIDA